MIADNDRAKHERKADDILTEPERRILQSAHTSELVDLSEGESKIDVAHGDDWGTSRTVRATLLTELLTGARKSDHGNLRILKLRGARITGTLDFEAATLTAPLLLRECFVEQPINLDGASTAAIRLPGCHVPSLSARQLCITGNLELNDGFTAEGTVALHGARIGGSLVLSGASLGKAGRRYALLASGLTVDQRMIGREGFTANGEVNLVSAHIGGTLDLDGAHLTNSRGRALFADSLTIGGDLFCRRGFTANGEVDLVGAHIGGTLQLGGAHLTNPKGRALSASRCTVDGSMYVRGGSTANGEVNLVGAHIGGILELDGAHLTNSKGRALFADSLTVDRSMYCRRGFTADGEVNLLGAHIGGTLELDGAHLTNPEGWALFANRCTVDGGMYVRKEFTANGEINLVNAHIGGMLAFNGAHLTNPKGRALFARGLSVEGDMLCREEFTAEAEINLHRARVGGQLDFSGASFLASEAKSLVLAGASIGELTFRPRHRPQRAVVLTNARVGAFDDDQTTWPVSLYLRGFIYETLENEQISVRDRLRWLRLHPGGYAPQIYDQLASAYRRSGQVEAARRVGVAKQRRRRRVFDPLNWLLYLTVGYGYRTWLATIWLTALTGLGAWLFKIAYPHHMIQATPKAPAFNSIAYTMDVLLPIVDLGQQKAWIPQGWAQGWTWFLIAAGWILTTAAVAGLTGIFKRD